MTQEALKLALEALEQWNTPLYKRGTAITAIKEALAQPDPYKQGYADAMNWKVQNHLEHLPTAQPEQEPVAWMDADGNVSDNNDHNCFPIPLYTTPPQRKPLTDEMRKQMKERCDSMEMRGAFVDGWLSAEAAHGIKENT